MNASRIRIYRFHKRDSEINYQDNNGDRANGVQQENWSYFGQ